MRDKATIKIPRELYDNLTEIIAHTGFGSVTEFIVFTMRTIASGGKIKDEGLTIEEAQMVRERLRKLGYID